MDFIKQKIHDYFEVMKEDKVNIKDQINVISINRILVFNIFNIFLQICNFVFYNNSYYLEVFYTLSIIAIVFSILIILYLFHLKRQSYKQSKFYLKVSKFLNIYHFLLVLILIAFSTAELLVTTNILHFFVYCFVITVCSPYGLKKSLLLVFPITLYVIILSILLELNYSLVLYVILFSMGSFVTSQLLYLSRYSYIRTIDRLKRENHKLYDILEYDKLTKIFNRYGHNNRLEDLVPKIISKKKTIAVIIMDIDYFKKVNDTEGHQKGDAVLSKIAGVIKKTVDTKLKKVDFISRYGGEEFFALATNVSYEEVKEISETFRIAVESLKIKRKYTEISPYVTISVGACIGNIASKKELESLIFTSDEALYYSKHNGRNKSTVFRYRKQKK